MHINKKLISLAVGSALTVGLGLPARADHDDTLLFPYVVKDTNRTTIVTIIGSGNPVSDGPTIHLQYWTKSTTAANTAACEPSSTTLTFTDNDIVTFDTAGILGAGPLFGDTTNLAPLGTSISYAGPRHGYLVVQQVASGFQGRGSWVEVDLANGGAHGDIAFGGSGSNGNFNLNDDYILEVENPASGFSDLTPVAFWPTSVVSTVFTVTPTGNNMATSDNRSVVMQVFNNSDTQGAYDRNENGIDGTVPQTVRCVGRLTASQLMPGVVSNAAWAATGGWGFLVNLGDGDTNYTESSTIDFEAAVYQVDTSTAAGAGKFMQNALRITSDND